MLRKIAQAAAIWALTMGAQPPDGRTPVSYAKDIQPILARQCTGCHMPQSRQGGLLLTSYDGFRQGGVKGPGFVPGKPAESVVIAYLTGERKPQMPFGGKPLSEEQINLFRRWIEQGARNDSGGEAAPAAGRKPVVYKSAPLITAFAFSPDGRMLAVSGYSEILLTAPDGKLLARLPGLSMRIHGIAFTPDGDTLVAAGGDPGRMGEVQIWDVPGRKLKHSIVGSSDTYFGGSLSPDGKLFAVGGGSDKSIRIIDVEAGKEIRRMDHHEDWVFQTAFGIDGKRLVTVGRDRAAKLSDVASGRFIENVNLLRDALTAVVRHPRRDWVAIGGADRVPYLYRMDRPRAMRIADDSTLIQKFEKQDGPILALALSPDGSRLAVACEAGDVRVYSTEDARLLARLTGHQGGVYAVQFTPDGAQVVTGGFDGQLRFYDAAGKMARSFVAAPLEVARSN